MGDGNSLCGMVGTNSTNNTKNWISVSEGIIHALEDDCANTVTTAVAIGVVVPSLARSSLAKEVATTQPGENVGVGQNVGTTSESGVAFTRTERGDGHIHGSETG